MLTRDNTTQQPSPKEDSIWHGASLGLKVLVAGEMRIADDGEPSRPTFRLLDKGPVLPLDGNPPLLVSLRAFHGPSRIESELPRLIQRGLLGAQRFRFERVIARSNR